MFLRGVAARPPSKVVAICDPNKIHAQFYNDVLQSLSQPPATYYPVEDFNEMLEKHRIETVVVTTVDAFHDVFVVQALEAGGASRMLYRAIVLTPLQFAVRVLTEKPNTVDVAKCRRINETCERLGRHITVCFNYRYNAVHELVKKTLSSGEIGKVVSVHFEW